jgi:ATP-dependent DNA helicase RecQ
MKKKIQQILKSVFGYDEFRDLQQTLIMNVLSKKHSLGIMPTGSGKSICYQIPALILPGLTIVVTPLISLMKDQVDQLRELGVKATFLNSSLPRSEYENIISDISRKQYKLLYIAPESLLTDRILWLLKSIEVSLITVDEAHCISEWGHDFRPEYRQLADLRDHFPQAIFLALTATATDAVRLDIARILKITSPNVFVSSFNRPNLFLAVELKTDIHKQITEFIKEYQQESGIIYCATRKQVDEYTHYLQQKGLSVLPYHAGLTDSQRLQNQEKFSRDDVQIMVATIAFGMGINKPNIRYILHTDLPKNIETYYQQIGRAGRDGEPATCLLLFNYGDIIKIKYFYKDKSETEQIHENNLLQQIVRFCEADVCRRQILLQYFGEDYTKTNCQNCDNCLTDDQEKTDLTIPVQKFLSCIWRTNELFGAGYIINILRGSKEKRILDNGHDKLSTYNIGTELSKRQWNELYSKLVSAKIISREEKYGSLKLTPAAWDILNKKNTYMGKLRPETKPEKTVPIEKIQLEYDQELFSLLRLERKRIAVRKNIPPYVIFPDKTLYEMAYYFPQSEESLHNIHGVGEIKAKTYAPFFLPLIQKYAIDNNKAEIPKKGRKAKTKPPKCYHTAELYNSGKTIPQIAAELNLSSKTILLHLHTYLKIGQQINRIPDHKDNFPNLREIEDTFPHFQELGTEFIRPIFEALNGKYSYDTLHQARLIYLIKSPQK